MSNENFARFEISTVEEAGEAIEYFNGFHDGFIQKFWIESRDNIEPDHSQSCTGVFDVTLEFAHYNYPPGQPLRPYTQRVRGEFRGVQGIVLDLTEGFWGNSINYLSTELSIRHSRSPYGPEDCLLLKWGRHYLFEGGEEWEQRESSLFTFQTATFIESAPGSD